MTFFRFEADFVDSLRCIPMIVRFKLDTCGVKLKLVEWNRFTQADCQHLVDLGCTDSTEITSYREYVSGLIFQHTGNQASLLTIDPQPPWLDERAIPPTVENKATEHQVNIDLSQWGNLTPLQRFALVKLTRSSHENNNFLPAVKEFGLSD